MPPLDLSLVRHVVSAYAAKRIFDLDDRDDFVQDVIIKFHRKVDPLQHPARQMSFAKQVAATMLVDWIRSRATLHRSLDIHAVPLPEEVIGNRKKCEVTHARIPGHHPNEIYTRGSDVPTSPDQFTDLETTLDLSDIGRLIYDGYSPSDIEVDFGYTHEEISEVVDKLRAEILERNSRLRARLGK